MSPKILTVQQHAPWSYWTISGITRSLFSEVRKQGALEASLGVDFVSRLYAHGPRAGFSLLYKLQQKFPRIFPAKTSWVDENQADLSKWIDRLPKDSAVLYIYHMPQELRNADIRRFILLDLSAYDARRTGTFGYANITDEEFEERRKKQLKILSNCQGVVTFSTYAADSISRDFGYPRERIQPIGCGPAIQIDYNKLPKPATNIPNNILFVGRDWKRKGGDLILQAWRTLKKRIPNAVLTIIGPLTQPANDEGIRYIGPIDKSTPQGNQQLLSEYLSASVFFMPTFCDTWGLVFSEAASLGLPIVSFRQWSLPDIVIDGKTGILVDQPDPDLITQALYDILSDPERARAMGQLAKERINTVLNWSSCAQRLQSFLLPGSCECRYPSMRE